MRDNKSSHLCLTTLGQNSTGSGAIHIILLYDVTSLLSKIAETGGRLRDVMRVLDG